MTKPKVRKKRNSKKSYDKQGRPRVFDSINTATVLALAESGEYTTRELAKLFECSFYLINNIKCGKRGIQGKVDKKLIAELGYKLCEACGTRIIPKREINGVILKKMCYYCYRGAPEIIEHNIGLIRR